MIDLGLSEQKQRIYSQYARGEITLGEASDLILSLGPKTNPWVPVGILVFCLAAMILFVLFIDSLLTP